ncbi:acyl-CoA dehydrogenase family protein [Nocardia sp. NPDC051756]|uniref:acyl-CoA dehydrogenase family protein n=1 Tax=Nocardia sp. NPDC051756 TaxID=3154751 RepID=UPI003413A03D
MTPNAVARHTKRVIVELEELLGDPLAPAGPFTFAETVEHEEREQVPPAAVAALTEWGMPGHLVPTEHQGRMYNLETGLTVVRSIARRNLTLAVMFGSTLLGAQPVWLWGTAEQRKLVAAGVLAGDRVCFAVSEPDAGSDLVANVTMARPVGDHYVLNGLKWPVGNASSSRFYTVLADSPRGHSLLLVDKEQQPDESMTARPRVRTLGLRGHDLSGIELHDTEVPATAVIGRPGRGVVATLKCLQITRTAIGGLSLGSMDAALRIGLDYARRRRLYGAEIYQLPVLREHLVGAHLDLLVAECVAIPVARSLSVVPARMALWSSVVKYLVPVIGEEVLAHVAKVLGARSYLRELVASGALQKIQRDHAITTIFEGTTHVVLFNIAAQLSALAPVAHEAMSDGPAVLRQLFDFTIEAPVWHADGAALSLATAGRDEITRGWRDAIAELGRVVAEQCGSAQAQHLAAVVTQLDVRRSALYDTIAGEGGIDGNTVRGSRSAVEHCVFHAASSCVQVWLHNRSETSDAGWLILALRRLLQRLEPGTLLDETYLPAFEAVMERLRTSGEYFTVDAVLG